MSVSLKSLGIDRLGVEERIALVEEIWDSIAADSAAVPLTTPQRDELDRRLADHASHPNDVVSWDLRRSSSEALRLEFAPDAASSEELDRFEKIRALAFQRASSRGSPDPCPS